MSNDIPMPVCKYLNAPNVVNKKSDVSFGNAFEKSQFLHAYERPIEFQKQ